MIKRGWLALLCVMLGLPGWAWEDELKTEAERSGYRTTGRYLEVVSLCRRFAQRWPEWVSWENFGTTPEGRPMLALVVSRSGARTPAQARAAGVPVVLIQGGIHAGEIDGKDAGFLALQQMLESHHPALEQVTVVFVPVFNVDGHERWGRWNRPNQVGPEEMGWRVTGQNLNLNRDYAKADAPEMQAMLGLLRQWDPILYVDLHVTDGSQFQPDIAILVEPVFVGDPTLQPLGQALQAEMMVKLRSQGWRPLDFYPSLQDHRDPASGFSNGAYGPRFSTGYWALRNRLAVLVETHSWKDYAHRVASTRDAFMDLVEVGARDGRAWREAAEHADRRSLAGQKLTLTYRTTEKKRMIDFPGYAYRHTLSTISGARALRYDPKTPKIWRIPFFYEVVPGLTGRAPQGGYVVGPAQASWLKPRLEAHGIGFQVLQNGLPEQPLEVFRADKVEFARRPFEGRMTASLAGEWRTEAQALPVGSLFIPIAQPSARLVVALLEPMAPDSLASWGFFNAHFERKEYMEEYVAEEVAAEMLASRPEVASEFRRRLNSDPEFAQSPEARLDFFSRRHPSWDQRFNLYPVMRIDHAPSGDGSSGPAAKPGP
jgi:hypothetical protein